METQAQERGRLWTLVLVSVGLFMVVLDNRVVNVALPSIHNDFGASVQALEWTVNAFTLAYASGIITAAALGDRLGRRRMFVSGLVVFSAASAACALAPSAGTLVAARAIQGIGAAMIMPLSLTILASAFPPARRGAIVGIWGGIGGLAIASGPLVGGAITQGLDWHWVFWVNVPIGVLAATLSRIRLNESFGPTTRLDLPAVVLATGGAVGIVWGLIRSGEAGWGSGQVLGLLAGGLTLIVAFLLWERRAPEPMLPLRLFTYRGFAAANATGFLMAGAITAAAFLTAQYFQLALGYSPLGAGLRLLPWTATPLLIAPLGGLVSDRIGARTVLTAGMLLQGIGLAWVAVIATIGAGYGGFVIPFIVAGVGVSMALPVVPTAVLSAVHPRDIGKASGVNSTLQRLGAAFAVAIAAAVFTANGHLGTAASFTDGFRPALGVVAGLSMLGAVSALAVTVRRRPTEVAQPANVEMAASA